MAPIDQRIALVAPSDVKNAGPDYVIIFYPASPLKQPFQPRLGKR